MTIIDYLQLVLTRLALVETLLSYSLGTQGKLLTTPQNTVIQLDTKSLTCSSDQSASHLGWVHHSQQQTRDIVKHCIVQPGFSSRYTTVTDTAQQCHLVLTNVEPAHGGLYGCVELTDAGDSIVSHTDVTSAAAYVNILGKLVAYTYQPDDIVFEGDTVNYKCLVTFYGQLIPEIVWRPASHTGTAPTAETRVNVNVQSNTVYSQLSVTVSSGLSVVPQYQCSVDLNTHSLRAKDQLLQSSTVVGLIADNRIDYNDTYTFPSLDVWYCPRDGNIELDLSTLSLTCSFNSQPAATFQWLDATLDTISTNSTIFLSQYDALDNLTCVAINEILRCTDAITAHTNVSVDGEVDIICESYEAEHAVQLPHSFLLTMSLSTVAFYNNF